MGEDATASMVARTAPPAYIYNGAHTQQQIIQQPSSLHAWCHDSTLSQARVPKPMVTTVGVRGGTMGWGGSTPITIESRSRALHSGEAEARSTA
jgi:hypothetical protein